MVDLTNILIFILIGFGVLLLNIFTSVWAYRDARRNDNSKEFSMIVLFGTLFFPIVGFIIYLIIRKDP